MSIEEIGRYVPWNNNQHCDYVNTSHTDTYNRSCRHFHEEHTMEGMVQTCTKQGIFGYCPCDTCKDKITVIGNALLISLMDDTGVRTPCCDKCAKLIRRSSDPTPYCIPHGIIGGDLTEICCKKFEPIKTDYPKCNCGG